MKKKLPLFLPILFFFLLILSSCSFQDEANPENRSGLNGTFNPQLSITEDAWYEPVGVGSNTQEENPFILTAETAISTFSIDADGGSYSNIRRYLEDGRLPPKEVIRTEEIINFFQYEYSDPQNGVPIALNGEMAACPWTSTNQLLRIGIKGKTIKREDMPPANFVFLIDVSGSMRHANKLDLLKEGFLLYTDYMRPQDRIAIVTYSGEAGVLLNSTVGSDKPTIKAAIEQLVAGGSTNGAGGIVKAYEIAEANFISGGNNRVILGTDGDFNVGISSEDGLIELIEEKRASNVFLSVLGVGAGNYQDGKMEQLANHGNGNYEYIDDLEQAQKVFIDEFGKFYTVAKDVKVQINFDPNDVYQYRLIGYENRLLEDQDFEDDTKDAGEIGAGQSINALYELTLLPTFSTVDPPIHIDFRYKYPGSDVSQGLSLNVYHHNTSFGGASENFRFTAAAAGFGLMLRDSQYKGALTWDEVLAWAGSAQDFDPNGYRAELLTWIQTAKELE